MEKQQVDKTASLGFVGICRESFKIISSWKKLFAQISFSLILPLCVLFLAHSWISQLLCYNIANDAINRDDVDYDSKIYAQLTHSIKSNSGFLVITEVVYFILLLLLSVLSTSAAVHAAASIFTGKDVTFTKAASAVTRVWKRLTVTFLWSLIISFIYIILFIVIVLVIIIFLRPYYLAILIGVILVILLAVGLVYMTMVLKLAAVVSVLEDVYGWKAILKSKALIKGRLKVSLGCYVALLVLSVTVQAGFECLAVIMLVSLLFVTRIFIGLGFSVIYIGVVLLELVVQTVLYFVCKSFHHESIDKLSSEYNQV
ncbi:hypothetical protein SAY87_017108 [Trapa incisa]|uniref:Uncharacterized protein n=1 Tax=Trapa incisa TaxID=236973 RepID=A0AAN7L761_9MYRT|nr:hypothetical protein SAY87_017108 [Trapa incisa]